jgi:hypothetical protein
MEKTPMQELIEWINSNTNERGNTRLNNFDIIDKAKSLLEKEKQVIIDIADELGINGNDYYNQKFKQ